MNSIITLKRLVELISKNSNISAQQSEDFIKAFTALIRDSLAMGEEVSVKDIGTFAVADGKVTFKPEAQLAEAINAPFAMFEPQELAPGMNIEEISRRLRQPATPAIPGLESQPQPVAQATASPQPEEPTKITEPIEAEVQVVQEEPAKQAEASKAEEPINEQLDSIKPQERAKPQEPAKAEEPMAVTPPSIAAQRPCPTEAPKQKPVVEKPKMPQSPKFEYRANGAAPVAAQQPEEQKRRPSAFWITWAAIMGLIVGIGIGYFLHDPIAEAIEPSLKTEEQAEEEATESTAIEDPLAEGQQAQAAPVEGDTLDAVSATIVEETIPAPKAEAAPVPQEVEKYDTIRSGNSLGTIAKRHYGNNVYWVYIYLENQDQIPNPNRISAGTRLKIPPLSKYAVSTNEEENRAAAQKKVNEVLSKYPQ